MKKALKKTLPVVLSAAMVGTAIPSLSYAETINSKSSSISKISRSVDLSLESPEKPVLQVTKNNDGSNTGYINVSWNSVPNAIGYKVAIFNGLDYEYFDVGNATSWTSQNKGIWPTNDEINSGRYQLHLDGTGAELPQDLSGIYYNSYAASFFDETKDFRTLNGVSVGIVAVYENGESAVSDAEIASFPEVDEELIEKVSPYINMDFTGQFSVNDSDALSEILTDNELQLVQQNIEDANELNSSLYYSPGPGTSVSVGDGSLTYTVDESVKGYIDGVTKVQSYWWGYKVYLSKTVVNALGSGVIATANKIADKLKLPYKVGLAVAGALGVAGYLISNVPHGVIIRVNKIPISSGIGYVPTWIKYQSN
ncbi:hypothetical protein [Bacillus sp. UNCCL81]|uniref:hypothetical protein n=1 Tax=Bacillus sp. UNCCL81 TaxID=1502755 RepID=UPI0008EE65E6|nr:hypothetical protein [Bacillus sp. UNCCL81]SFD61812.1 hypothetical protein SAMN02799633_04305 [Bacillus sp. UNCCL81]